MMHVIYPHTFGLAETGQLAPTWDNAKAALNGGHIAVLPIDDGRLMLVDEDGESKRLPMNLYASELAATRVRSLPPLLGTVVLIELSDVHSVLGTAPET